MKTEYDVFINESYVGTVLAYDLDDAYTEAEIEFGSNNFDEIYPHGAN